MSTLRISNIEAKANGSSPSVDEKLKFTNSSGDVLVHLDGKTSGITTIGINTTAESLKFDSNNNIYSTGIITATKFSGIIDATTASFSGNVSIAGTLTYQDVTNIDSVGVITARNGIDCNGNATFGANGSITTGSNFTLSGNALTVTGANTVVGEFKRAGNATIQCTDTTNSTDLQLRANSDGGLVRTATNKPLVFGTNQLERLRISSAGKVGIGTNDPKQPVSITGRVSIDAKNDYYGVWADGDTGGENHISVGRWYNTGGGLKSGYSQYGINNLVLTNNHPTAAHTLIIQPNGQKVAIGTHVHSNDHLVAVKGTVKATDYVGDYPLSNRRINMNGDFKIAQRTTSKTNITSNGRYVWDRWYWQNHGPTVTHTQDFSTVPVGQGFRSAAKIETTSAAGSAHAGNVMAMVYAWEGQDLIRLKYGSANAESLTVSFWARSSRTGDFVTTLKHDSKLISEKHTISSANTYQKYTWVIPGDTADAIGSTGANSGMSFYVYISTGTNTNSGAHMANWGGFHNAHMAAGNTLDLVTNTGTFYITGIQVEHGEVVTPYEHISYGDELRKCQRYYYKTDAVANGDGYRTWAHPFNHNANARRASIRHPVQMRTTPTISNIVHDEDTGADQTSGDALYVSDQVWTFRRDCTNTTSGYARIERWEASAEL